MSFLFPQCVNPPQLPAFQQGANERHIEETRIRIHQAVLKVDETSITSHWLKSRRGQKFIIHPTNMFSKALISALLKACHQLSWSPRVFISMKCQDGNRGEIEPNHYLGSLENSLRVQSLGLSRIVLVSFNPANVLTSSVTPFAQTLNIRQIEQLTPYPKHKQPKPITHLGTWLLLKSSWQRNLSQMNGTVHWHDCTMFRQAAPK